MRKKKIVFSTSGGNPATHFMSRLMAAFGENEIGTIASRIAATCRTTPIRAGISITEGEHELRGNTADCVNVDNGTLNIGAENIEVIESTLIIG